MISKCFLIRFDWQLVVLTNLNRYFQWRVMRVLFPKDSPFLWLSGTSDWLVDGETDVASVIKVERSADLSGIGVGIVVPFVIPVLKVFPRQ